MSVLEIKNLSHRYDDRWLFEKANLVVNNGEHIGVVGLNGAGKSTFINILDGRLSQDEGEVNYLGGVRRGYLDQYATVDGSLTVMEYLLQAFDYLYAMNDRLEEIYTQMESAQGEQLDLLIKRSASLSERLVTEGFYDLESKVKKVANGLGVNKFGYNAVIANLSGGERAKLMLSKLLLSELDIMLLDEPTNFLDVEHVEWLVKYLNSFKKTFLVISHDVEFLDKVCKQIVNIENGRIKKYSGNYTRFTVQRAEDAKQYEDEYNRQQAEIKRTMEYIERNKARASTAKMARSRQKKLDKMNILSTPTEITECTFTFPYVDVNAKEFVKIKNLSVGYSYPLIENINILMNSTDKLWIRGTNGVGKTTLLKTLMRVIAPKAGSFFIHPEAKILYLEQDLNFDDKAMTAVEYYSLNRPMDKASKVRQSLASVGIKGDLATKPMVKLSGGEQVRVKLSVLTTTSANLLVLDEPTNHLDVIAKKALKQALIDFEGAIILVSHETEFAKDVCNIIFDAKAK